MNTSRTVSPRSPAPWAPAGGTRLVARTLALTGPDEPGDLLDHLGPHGFAWLQGDAGFVTSGVAARLSPTEAEATLSAVEHAGARPRAPAGPLAVGALPFDQPGRGELVVPARVVGRDAGGHAWCTVIGPSDDLAVPERPHLRNAPRPPSRFTVAATVDRDRWVGMVEEALAAIGTGAVSKVVLAREVLVEADAPFDVPSVLARLRATQPGCSVFACGGFVGASPELLVRVDGPAVLSRPMAGTAPRGGTREEDEAAVAALLVSAKDAAEHRMVVDAVSDVLRSHCGDLRVGTTEVERLATVMHLATTIRARRAGAESPGALDLALALHPTPAVGGTPRGAALELVERLEPHDRGLYAGPVGWVAPGGDGAWAVALRSATLDATAATTRRPVEPGSRGGWRARLLAGAGIVAGSQPAAEWAETQAKFEPMLRALVRP